MLKVHLKNVDLTKAINEVQELREKAKMSFYPIFIATIQSFRNQLVERIFCVRKRKNKYEQQEVLRRFEDGRTFCKNLYYGMMGYRAIWSNNRYYYDYEPNEIFYEITCEPNLWIYNTFTLEDIIELRPDLKYCAWNGDGSFMIYLRELHKCPYVEMLSKLDLQCFIGKKTIEKKLDNKSFRKFLFANVKEIREHYLDCQQVIAMFNHNKSVDEVIIEKYVRNWTRDYYFQRLLKENPFLDANKLITYLYYQNTDYNMYEDFINAVKFLKLDTTQEKNVYPHDFMKWHDLYTEQVASFKNKEIDSKIKKVAQKYAPILKSIDDIVMVFPKGTKDFINEGNTLKHCVGRMGYNKKMAKEESLIIFIRKKEEIDTPFLTLEYDPNDKRVIQFYGYHDTKPEQHYQDIIYKKWLPKVKQVAI